MSRALWLAFGALSLGFVAASCTGSDGSADFDNTAGEGAGGDSSSTAGTSSTSGKNGTGGSNAEAGAGSSEGGSATGGVGSSAAGAPGGGGDTTSGGMPGGGGDATSGGMPGGGGDATTGGVGDIPGVPCTSVENCVEGQVCFKEGCKLEAGVCRDAEAATPVCGCDGITYYDGNLAAGAGVDVGARGICSGDGAVTCEGKCEEGYTCGIVGSRGATCLGKVGGVCWMVPKECPLDDATVYNVCGTEKCLNLCEAVVEGAQAVPSALICGGIIN